MGVFRCDVVVLGIGTTGVGNPSGAAGGGGKDGTLGAARPSEKQVERFMMAHMVTYVLP